MRSFAALLSAFFLLVGSAVASAGTVTAVKASAASAAVGATVTVTASGTNPCGAANIDYGDGTAITYAITGLPTTQSHVYQKPGTYTIVGRGMGNCDGEATARIEVTGQPAPTAPPASEIVGVGFTPKIGVAQQPVAINVAGQGPCSFTISFGDGNQQDMTGTLPQRINHTYALARSYTVIVAPAAPCVGKFTEVLQVTTRGGERITGLTIEPEPASVGRSVTIVVEGTGNCGYRIQFGDGNHEDRSRRLPDRVRHVYNASGTYTIVAEASGICEGRVQRSLDVR
jgi:hypothetical protein